MKTRQISNNFILESNNSIDNLSYNKNPKDTFDLLIITATTLFIIGFTIFSSYIIYNQEFSWFNLLILLILVIGSVFQLIKFLSKLLSPKSKIISIDNNLKFLEFRNHPFKKKRISFSELNKLEYVLKSDLFNNYDLLYKNRYYIELFIVTKNQNRIKVLNYNPRNIIIKSDDKTKKKLLKDIKPLVSEISKILNIESRYIGIKN